jgi:hypothetical protein
MQIEGGRLPGNNPPKMEVRQKATCGYKQERWSQKNEKKRLIL